MTGTLYHFLSRSDMPTRSLQTPVLDTRVLNRQDSAPTLQQRHYMLRNVWLIISHAIYICFLSIVLKLKGYWVSPPPVAEHNKCSYTVPRRWRHAVNALAMPSNHHLVELTCLVGKLLRKLNHQTCALQPSSLDCLVEMLNKVLAHEN